MELWRRPAHELRALALSGKTSFEEITRAHLERVAGVDGRLHAFVTVCEDAALAAARRADERLAAEGERIPALCGVPVAVKDNICIDGIRTTCSSRILENFVAPYDATVAGRLKEAGAVILGKTNMDEFAMGSSTENSAFGLTRNPWDAKCVPGGSSGGSAAAVAAGEAPLALGSDTGGSIRQPAAFCGVLGLKPTYGRVSRYGLVAFASSLDQIGPFARDVKDLAALLQVVSGYDRLDSTSVPAPVEDYSAGLEAGIEGLVIGLPKEYFAAGLDPRVKEAVTAAVGKLEECGARVTEVSLPHTEYAVATYYLICTAEASSNLARYDGVRYGYRAPGGGAGDEGDSAIVEMYKATRQGGFGPEVKRRIMLGTFVLSAGFYDAYYLRALKARTLLKRDFEKAFEVVDIVATPTSPTPAFREGEKTDDPLQMYLSDIYTISCNLAGIPGLSVPCGLADGLPVGLQLLGRPLEEATLLRAARAYEQAVGWQALAPEGAQ